MQDQNNENTLPIRVQSGDSTQNSNPDETRPVRVTAPQQAQTQPPAGQPTVPAAATNFEATRPMMAQPQPAGAGTPPPSEPAASVRIVRWPWFILGVIIMLLFGSVGGYIGYRTAIDLRKAAQAEQVVSEATYHFMFGLEAQQKGQYSIARKQFEYVISLDPKFPGAAEKLTEVMIAQMATETPTVVPTATEIPVTPTPDTRSQEEIYNLARSQFLAQDWDAAMKSIYDLRAIDRSYRSVECDGMLYVALRYRGIRKIYQEANLEGGIYDLALAERFAPLDGDASSARTWARLYLNGVSFWGADWARVVAAFEEIYPAFPNLRDASGKTAVERYREAAFEQAKVLETRRDNCVAVEYYTKALSVAPDATIEQRATQAYQACNPATETPSISMTPTLTPSLSGTVTETTPVPAETTPVPAETTIVPSETPTTSTP